MYDLISARAQADADNELERLFDAADRDERIKERCREIATHIVTRDQWLSWLYAHDAIPTDIVFWSERDLDQLDIEQAQARLVAQALRSPHAAENTAARAAEIAGAIRDWIAARPEIIKEAEDELSPAWEPEITWQEEY